MWVYNIPKSNGYKLAKMCFQMKDRLICQENNGIIKKISERGFVYETICYVCIALAIAKNKLL